MQVLTIIINYQTPDLLMDAVTSFKKFYAEAPLLIVDNGSKDNSKEVIEELTHHHPKTTAIYLEKNLFHGPAMDQVLQTHNDAEFMFFLDSDTVTTKNGFLEDMIDIASDDEAVYAIGQQVYINRRGFKDDKGYPIIVTPYLFMRTEYYSNFSPFIHHGQPTIHNFYEANQLGYKLVDYPITEYIDHLWRGTANRFGYGLGIKGKIDYLLNKFGL